MKRRYVASNRFKTRGGKAAAKFEARWANRKSRLAELEGFRYFSLFREVPVEDVVGLPRRRDVDSTGHHRLARDMQALLMQQLLHQT